MSREVELGELLQYINAVDGSQLLRSLVVTISYGGILIYWLLLLGGRARNPHLIGTARFASINGHLGVGKCEFLGPCYAKTDNLPSATSL